MKVDNSVKSVGGLYGGTSPRPAASGLARPSPAGDQVALSTLSTQLQKTEVSAGEAPVSAARVAEIKQAITEGRFKINPERIADGLLDDIRQMLAAKR